MRRSCAICNHSCTIFTRKLCGKIKSSQGNQRNYDSKKEEGNTKEVRSTRQSKGKAEDQEFCEEIHEEFQTKDRQEEGCKIRGARGDAQTGNEASFAEAPR
jgi:hypothetical protein